MKKLAFLMFPLVGLAACASDAPPPPPPPQTTEIIGEVRSVAGDCHIIVSDTGATYAVRPGVLPPNAMPGSRVRVSGVVDPAQACPGATLIRAEAGAMVLAEAGPRRGRMMVPK